MKRYYFIRHPNALLDNSVARFKHWRSGMRLGERTKSLLCVLGLALLPFVVFWEVAAFREIPFMGDIIDYYYPTQYLFAQQIRQGNIPLWNNRAFSGFPFQSHIGTFYPLNLLFVLMPTWVAMTYSVLIHFALAGVFTYLYARALGMGRKGAVVAGVTFMFCGFSMAHLGHHNINHTLPWLPLILWAVERWRQRFELKYIGLGALATGLMFLGGHPQIPIYSMGVAAVYVLFFTLFSGKSNHRWRITLGGGAMMGLGLLIASPLAWDLYELSRSFGGALDSGSYEYCTGYSLPPQFLLHMIFPRLFQRDIALTEMAGYIGILPWALAVLAVLHWKHKARGFLLLTAVFSLLLVLGKYTPLYRLMYRVPVYNAFRVAARNWFEFDFALAVLAGAGFDCLISARNGIARRLSRWARGLGIGLILLDGLVVATAVWLFPERVQRILVRNGIAMWTNPVVWLPLVMILASSIILFIIASRSTRWYSVVLVTALIVADLYFSFADYVFAAHSTRQPPSEVFAEAFDHRPDSVEFLEHDQSSYRVLSYSPGLKVDRDEKYSLLTPNLNLLFDIDSADAYHGGMVPTQYMAFSDNSFFGHPGGFIHPRLFRPDHNTILSLLNVKYILTPTNPDQVRWGNMTVDQIILDTYPYLVLQLGATSGLLSATLDLPAYPATTLAIASSLGDGAALGNDQRVARVMITDEAGRVSTYYLTAGQHTAELTYDCNPTAVNHSKAPIAYDLPSGASCPYHMYFARLELGAEPVVLRQVTLEYLLETGRLYVDKASLYNAQTGASYPVSVAQGYLAYLSRGEAYRKVYEDEYVRIYQNTRVLPRAFLVPGVEYVNGAEEANQIVRQGVFPDGRVFTPTEVALVEATLPASPPAGGAITLYAHPVQPELWTVVQWQDAQGGWHDVEGWQGPFNQENQVVWWVAPAGLGKGPFRWTVYQSQGGQLLAISDSFYLPDSADTAVRIELPLLWPHNAPSNKEEVEGDHMRATVVSARAGWMELKVSTDQNAFLVYSENYFPDWRAKVDGRPVTVYRTDGTLLGVPVPAGEHRVVLTYRPFSLYLLAASFVALLIIVGLISGSVRTALHNVCFNLWSHSHAE